MLMASVPLKSILKKSMLGVVPLSITCFVYLFSYIRVQGFYITDCISSIQTDEAKRVSDTQTCNFDSDGVLLRARPFQDPSSAVTIAQFHGYQAGHTSAPPAFYEQADLVFHCYPRNTEARQMFPDASGIVYLVPPFFQWTPVIFYVRDGPADPINTVQRLG